MKQALIILLCIAGLSACEKITDPFEYEKGVETVADGSRIKGKVVHRSCATVAVQVLNSNFFNLGQESWQQASNKPVYQHVFSVDNICSFPGTLQEGQEFYFKVISNDPEDVNCVTCALADNPPQKQQIITVVE